MHTASEKYYADATLFHYSISMGAVWDKLTSHTVSLYSSASFQLTYSRGRHAEKKNFISIAIACVGGLKYYLLKYIRHQKHQALPA